MSKFLQSNILSLVLLAALMGFATTWQAEAKRAASMGPTVVATVNLNTVMDGLAERADLQAELATLKTALNAREAAALETFFAKGQEFRQQWIAGLEDGERK